MATFTKQAAIERLIARYVAQRAWLNMCQKDASAFLTREERGRRVELDRLCEEAYAKAGLDSRGRVIEQGN